MATNKICDVCNNPAAQPVHVVRAAIEVLAAVEGSQSTGCVHEIESCEGCWPKAMADLSANVSAQLARDIPVHREVYAANDAIALVTQQLKAAVIDRDSRKPGTVDHKQAVDAANEFSVRLETLEAQRAQLLASVS